MRQRRAIYAAYAFCRICDDIADGDLSIEEKRSRFDLTRQQLQQSRDAPASDPVFVALRDTVDAFSIPVDYFEGVIEGVETDLTVTRYRSFDELRDYCYNVASAVGLVCIEVFGYKDARAKEYAVDLGLAMQLTNIVRDLKEDARRGRIYIPLDEIRSYGYSERELLNGVVNDAFQELMSFQVARARRYFASGRRLIPLVPLRSRACPALLVAVYSAISGPHRELRLRRLPGAHRPQHKGKAADDGEAMGGKPDTGVPAQKVVVLGGGLAGLSAARRLLERGFRVQLVEKRPFLGGRAYSFRDGPSESEVDNGQHVFLGCCAYYIDFLRATAAFDKAYLQKRLKVEVVRDGRRGVLGSARYLGPLHLLPSFVSYPHLGLKDKLLALYGFLRVNLTDRSKSSSSLDEESFHHWLKRHHQTDRAVDNLWNLFILPSLNDDVRDVSANMALMVFQESLLKGPRDAAIGYSRVGLTSLNGDPAGRFIEERGGEMKLGKTVRALRTDGDRVCGAELSDGSVVEGDAYVSSLPSDVLLQLLPHEVAEDPFFARASGLGWSPIVGIHLWYDRPVMDQDFVPFLNSPVQFVFNKSLIQGRKGQGQYVCISLSGAWQYIKRPKEELLELFVDEMANLFPRAREAEVQRSLVVKEPQATFRSAPGAAVHRLPQVTPMSNLFLAGEWTETGWPSTMEGAVRSGVYAADALAARFA